MKLPTAMRVAFAAALKNTKQRTRTTGRIAFDLKRGTGLQPLRRK